MMDSISLSEKMDIKRASMLSEHQFSLRDPKTNKSKQDLAPPDPFHITRILFFFLGLGSTLPYAFFLTSQEYWMYKFRDTSLDTVDLRNKTLLQQNFVSISGLAHTIPSILTTFISSYYGHKVNIYKRMIATLSGMLGVFLVFTAFIEVNTDSWQLEFFILTITVSAGITIASSLLNTTNLVLIARFPNDCLRAQVYGEAFSSVLSASLQVLCLYLGNKSYTKTALIYFLSGSGVLVITVIFAVVSRYIPRFIYYLGDTQADTKRPTLKFKEMRELAKILWPNIILMITSTITAGMGHPNITTLVVPENYGHGDPWADKYFQPVITFLLHYVVSMCARYFAKPMLTRQNAVWWVLADSLRYVTFHPLFLFCNAQPRKHLPVLFPHDWEYIIIVIITEWVGVFFYVSTFMSMKNMLPGRPEQGYLLIASLGSVAALFHSVLATFWVNLI